ncbi:MAG TPA: Gfo/Idh/MocA family oxidoreductase [Chloroflexota bacterium]|nr:Gfo/Idh/MocA family oxidoreductase [Chloroflexota bacterium]
MIRVGLLGAGMIGQVHADAYATLPDVEVVSVAGLGAERAARLAEALGATPTIDIMAAAADPRVDVVDVCLPTALHQQATEVAARAGKDVICEKPLALTLEAGRRMIGVCRTARVHLLPAMVVRFFPQYQALAGAVRDGAIGTPASCTLVRQGFYPSGSGGWYRDESRSGGIFLDLMIHDFDWALARFGPAERVFAQLRHAGSVPFTQGMATVRHRSGVLTQLTGTWGHPGPFTTRIEVAGTGGLLQYDSRDSESLELLVLAAPEDAGDVPLPNLATTDNPYRTELLHFFEVISGHAAASVTAEDSLRALALALCAREAARTGRPMAVPSEAA